MLKDSIEKQEKNYEVQFKIKKNIKGFNWKKNSNKNNKNQSWKLKFEKKNQITKKYLDTQAWWPYAHGPKNKNTWAHV